MSCEQKLSATAAARMIDISAVRTHHSYSDAEQLCALAKQHRFVGVHMLPCWTKQLAGMLADCPDIYVGGPVGFPSGGQATEIKLAEAAQLIADDVRELDIVMNIGKFLGREQDYVLDELQQIVSLAKPLGIATKVVIEMGVLPDYRLEAACELAIESGADYLKTGTGWIPGGADIERVARVKQICGRKIKVKAAGGIRTPRQFLELYELGVERMGINATTAAEIIAYLGNASKA